MRMISWLSRLLSGDDRGTARRAGRQVKLGVERLENREVPATFSFNAGVLTVNGTPFDDRIAISTDATRTQIVVQDSGRVIARLPNGGVTGIQVFAGDGNDRVQITSTVLQPAVIDGGSGNNVLIAGAGPTTLIGGSGTNKLGGGAGTANFQGGTGNDLLVSGTGGSTGTADGGSNKIYNANSANTVTVNQNDQVLASGAQPAAAAAPVVLTTDEVRQILDRASAATRTNDAIITIVDRNGRVLGIKVENGVATNIVNDPYNLVFAVDGSLAKARTAAFFASNSAPLTSRTINDLSQSTNTQREIEAYPSIVDPNSTLRGPGFVAPVRIGAHFPPSIPNTPEVDLFAIEHTNRDSVVHPGPDGIKGTADDVVLPTRFNVAAYDPGKTIYAPESYGLESNLQPQAQARGIATLPGGIPLFKNGTLVGGIGVFFPGKTGFATEENSQLGNTYDPSKPDRSLEAEYIAFAAAGGSRTAGFPIGTVGGVPAVPGFDLPSGRIDLVGIQLNVFGPGGSVEGPRRLVAIGNAIGPGVNNGLFEPINGGADKNLNTPADNVYFRNGLPVPDGWLVSPKDGVGITAAEVRQIINNGIQQANVTRAAIRLPLNSPTRMVFAVADRNGNIVGLFRMPDATVFSIDVAVAKARNVNYYNDASKLQPIDELPGIKPGVSFTNRTFRFLSLPRYPSAAEGTPPAYFSQLNVGGSDLQTGTQVGPRLPASAYFNSVLGHDSFYPNTNFHDPTNILNQNGIVFFPGSSSVYRTTGNTTTLIGGFGVSGDGVDQDDVVTTAGIRGFEPNNGVLRADQVFFRGVRLPYNKFNRNPEGGIIG